MSFGFGSAIDLELVVTAKDMATGVLEGIGQTLQSIISTTADFQTTLTQAQNNTTMTTADAEKMRQTVLALNSQSGAPLGQLADGFRLIYSTGFDAAQSTQVLDAAMKSAVGTGSNVSDVAATLALQMHDFGLGADQAGAAMNVLHLASADSRVTMQDFATETSKATAMAAALGMPMQDVDAALAALTLHFGSAAMASTALFGELAKLVAPTTAAGKELAYLQEQTGIPLVQDFTLAGFQAKGFTQIMADLKAATGGNTDEVLKLIPAMRGGLAAMVLQTTGTQDYTRILKDLNAAMAGEVDPTTQAYNRTLGTFNQTIAVVQADFQQFLMTIGQPIIDSLMPYLQNLITFVTTHKKDIDDFGTALGKGVGGAVTGLIKDIPILVTDVGKAVKQLETFATGVGNFFDTAGTGIHEALFDLIKGLDTALTSMGTFLINNVVNPVLAAMGQNTITLNPRAQQDAVNADLARLFPDLNPRTGAPYQGGGGGAYADEMAGVNLEDPAAVKAWLTKYHNPHLGGSVDADLRAQRRADGGGGGGGGGGKDHTSLPPTAGYQDYQQASAAAERARKDALDQFTIDLNRFHANLQAPDAQRTLQADIAAILGTDVPLLGYDAKDRAAEQSSYLREIAAATKGTHAAVTTNWRVFAPFQSAGEGQTIAAYGLSAGQSGQARTIAALERLVAQQDAKLRQDEQMIAYYQQMLAREGETARNTAKTADSLEGLARAASTPKQAQNPLLGRGVQAAGRG